MFLQVETYELFIHNNILIIEVLLKYQFMTVLSLMLITND